jgi:predicted DNA-binding transcriptional regulator AlpA
MYIRDPPHRGRCRAPLPPSRHHGQGRAVLGWRVLVRHCIACPHTSAYDMARPIASEGRHEQMDKLMSGPEVAARLGVCDRTLKRWRMKGDGPPFIRYTATSTVRYHPREVNAWIDSRKSGGEMG